MCMSSFPNLYFGCVHWKLSSSREPLLYMVGYTSCSSVYWQSLLLLCCMPGTDIWPAVCIFHVYFSMASVYVSQPLSWLLERCASCKHFNLDLLPLPIVQFVDSHCSCYIIMLSSWNWHQQFKFYIIYLSWFVLMSVNHFPLSWKWFVSNWTTLVLNQIMTNTIYSYIMRTNVLGVFILHNYNVFVSGILQSLFCRYRLEIIFFAHNATVSGGITNYRRIFNLMLLGCLRGTADSNRSTCSIHIPAFICTMHSLLNYWPPQPKG